MTEREELNEVEKYNKIYNEKGFKGVIHKVFGQLHIGRLTGKKGIVKITTGGWSDDEEIIHNLTHMLSLFGNNHYIGYIVGGSFFFAEHKECTTGNYEIIETLTDDETCNPKICCWCQYSTNGKRDPARSITLCDGCRYNENFEHIEIKVRL